MIPKAALPLLPILAAEIASHAPNLPLPVLAGQIEQETCITLTHAKCWNPRAELKTAREYGVGLGQLTKTAQFDNIEAAKALHASLAAWGWSDRYNATYQIRALVLMDARELASLAPAADTPDDAIAFALSAYNGGRGGVFKDRTICAATAGCNPRRWFGHVERYSFRAQKAVHGYGKSFFEINREYVRNILGVRQARYREWRQQPGES